jgi:cytidylate kinase
MASMWTHTVITIDGPVGAGKSVVARALAKRLGVRYLDTGAMYRAVTLKALREGVDLSDPDALTRLAESSDIRLIGEPGGTRVLLDGDDVTGEIRTREVTNHSYAPSQTPGVRARLVQLQRQAGADGPLVTEGRDQGTVVFPDAAAKFYLDASVEERARRRHRELTERGETVPLEDLAREITVRDKRDSTRSAAPLRAADDAIRIDSTDLSIDQVVDAMVAELQRRERTARETENGRCEPGVSSVRGFPENTD